jgi:hypothetical protein
VPAGEEVIVIASEAKQSRNLAGEIVWVASSLTLFAMTCIFRQRHPVIDNARPKPLQTRMRPTARHLSASYDLPST